MLSRRSALIGSGSLLFSSEVIWKELAASEQENSLFERRLGNSFFDDRKILGVTPNKIEGYIGLAVWDSGASDTPVFDSLKAIFKVPNEPTEVGDQTVYFFPGVQQLLGQPSILQPVLQWASSAPGEKKSWSIRSFFVRGTPQSGLDVGAYSHLKQVSTATELAASVSLKDIRSISGRSSFVYSCEFEDVPETYIEVELPKPFAQIGVGLEVYNAGSCRSLPNEELLKADIVISHEGQAVTPSWRVRAAPVCEMSVTANADGDGVGSKIVFSYKQ